jgi:hypothetical protein
MSGWRFWMLTRHGELYSLLDQSRKERYVPWPGSIYGSVRARCVDSAEHNAPEPGCACGVRIMPRWVDLHKAVVSQPAAAKAAGRISGDLGPVNYQWGGLEFLLWRTAEGVSYVPDVIGRVDGWGRIEKGVKSVDPYGTVRAEFAGVGSFIHVSGHLAGYVPLIRRNYPLVDVHLGRARGLPWLDEIAATVRE